MRYESLIELSEAEGHNVGYKEDAKKEFIRLGRKYMKGLMAILEGQGISEMVLDYNKAGIAVSGEFTLQGEYESGKGGFYIQLSMDSSGQFGFFRSTKGLKDYTGGRNYSILPKFINAPEDLVSFILSDTMQREASSLKKDD